MYGIYTYIWIIYGVNVAKYTIHGSSEIGKPYYYGKWENQRKNQRKMVIYPQGNVYISMEHHHVQWVNSLFHTTSMFTFKSYFDIIRG